MNWTDDELRQQTAHGGTLGVSYTVYLASGRHKWTVARTVPGGGIEWCGEYFDGREKAKASALSLTYSHSSIPSPELNEAVVKMFEPKHAGPTISLCLIVKDGEPYLRKCLESIVVPTAFERYKGLPAFDEIVFLLDSRTTDRSEEIAREFAAKQEAMGGRFIIARHDWPDDFSVARQRSFEMATGDWRGWIDSDDVLLGADKVRPLITENKSPEVVLIEMPYNYIAAPDGRVKMRQIRERFCRWDYGFMWRWPVHEALVPSSHIHNPRAARLSDGGILFVHQRPESEVLEHGARNLALLDPSKATSPIIRQRLLHQRACLIRAEDPEGAEKCWREVVGMVGIVDDDSSTTALLRLAELLADQGRFDEGKSFALRYVERKPKSRKGPLYLGYVYAKARDWFNALRWIEFAFAMPKPEEYQQDDEAQFVNIAACAALSYDSAFEVKERILALAQRECPPIHEYVFVRDLEQVVRNSKMADAAHGFVKYVADHDEVLRALSIHSALPYPLKRSEAIALHRRKVNEYVRLHGTAEVNETWGPIKPEYVATAIADDRTGGFGVYGRSVWLAEQIWRLGWKKVLDIGCADGLVTGYLSHRFPNVEFVGIDPDRYCIEHARRMWAGTPNVRFEVADFEKGIATIEKDEAHPTGTVALDHYADWCDGYVMSEVMEHVRRFSDLWRPDKPGLLTTPRVQPDYGVPPFDALAHNIGTAAHLRIFSLAEILDEVRASEAVSVADPKNPHWGIVRPAVVNTELQRFVFVCAAAPWTWGPETPYTRGLTGSEECVVYLAEALAASGHRVVVCNGMLEGDERIVRGVMWTGLDYLNEHDLYDPDGSETTLVFWRQPVLPPAWKTLPGRRVLWLHDAASQYKRAPAESWGDFDKIVCATDYHKRTIDAAIPAAADRTVVIRHGIPEMPTAAKVPGKVIYASSPDRGLERLLAWWPDVKARVPHATLHVFYGTANIRPYALMSPELGEFADRIEAKLKEMEPLGVVNHGLVSHPEIHQQFAEAQVLAYPTTFEEIACLTVQKAMAAKAAPVWSVAGCLGEVVGTRYHAFWDDLATIDSDGARESFARSIVYWLNGGMDVNFSPPSWPDAAKEWASLR